MIKFRASITKRSMERKQRNGETSVLDRYVLNYKDPMNGQRKSQFFETRKEAEAAQQQLYKAVSDGAPIDARRAPTVAKAVEYWMDSHQGRVGAETIKSYKWIAESYIVGPMFEGTKEQKVEYRATGKVPSGVKPTPLLGHIRITELTTARIRMWHQTLLTLTTPYIAKTAKKHLSSVLALVGEDLGMPVPLMPRRVVSGYRKKERILLRQDQIREIFEYAKTDRYGLYYTFLFMTGLRPGEMLGLLWEDVDFVANLIHVRRNQQRSGVIKDTPKTAAGQREVPMVPALREALLAWKKTCPRREGAPERVFPALGYKYSDPGTQYRSGGPLTLCNFRNRVWKPMLQALDLPPVTPYVARHMVISSLQAEGVEVAMVAKIAGHANPQITLQHYSHAVRDSGAVMDKLSTAYGIVDG